VADGPRLDLADDDAEQLTLEEEARLIRHVRWRLVAWSGISTMVILVILGFALYAAASNALAAASIGQLQDRINPAVQLLQGTDTPFRRPDLGYVLGTGNTLLYLFDSSGNPVQSERPVAIPVGLPALASLTAAQAAPDGTDVRAGTLQLASGQGGDLPIRIMTRTVVAQDGNTYFLQALQDRSTEVATLNAVLTVLLLGGVLVVIVSIGFGTIYANRALVPIRQSLDAQRGALRRQREFAADASHELRTPLTVIRSSLEHLSRHRDRPISASADAQEALDDIDAEVTHLSSLVGDLLLLARSDSGAVVMEQTPVDLGDIAFDAASAVGRTAENRGVRVLVDPEPTMVTGDSARLRQLVMILADNAVRHSPRNGQVGVIVRATGSIASIEVTDQGPGVREEDMAHVFDRFWRAPGAPSGGTGLGLAIARWIVDQHGGRIGVSNRPEGGAAFRVELPAMPGLTTDSSPEPPEPIGSLEPVEPVGPLEPPAPPQSSPFHQSSGRPR
jgi:two-component system sensor histidine kinase CiaH